ncbi:glycoside hydrolase family 32 protein [Edaphobacter sp. 12200R-103]|jgi:beta-fructofuranosidase|uniref:glycoside hydrolase family 32 protein n=1 Tax=Edaphobacter sp. 12200R-103 TaxID=2703788 RepID=UPI00138C90BB|nr:glycoside hydrolase family 32 protein [Edaphobacter sp. 12200R-103]QHS50828.1 glycoside hydrolase family 32 protein [Edaphobacter sp. 12200R-103]
MVSKSRRKFLLNMAGAATLAGVAGDLGASESATASLPVPLSQDPLRPQYHLLPAKNWMNDPNGPIYWKGKYHMFFQYNPNAAIWGDMHWDHAVSEDMIHWRHMAVAIAPTPGGPDEEGVFSGTAFVQDGRVGMMYTGVKKSLLRDATIKDSSLRETQCIAFANDEELSSFTKVAEPVIATPPVGMQVNGFRDPSPWRQGDWWYTPIASGFPDIGGAILLYRSKDLRSWEFVKVFAQREPSFEAYIPWDVWECPEFFSLGDRHVLLFSTMGKAFWQTGQFDSETLTFTPEQMGILDYGSYYAPKTQLDASGNRILWGWIQESRPVAQYKSAGWAGMMSLPRVMSLAADGTLRYKVADSADALRGQELRLRGKERTTVRIKGCCGEAIYRTRRKMAPFKLVIEGDRSKERWIEVEFDPSYPDKIFIDARPLKLSIEERETIEIRLHIDSSVIELIVSERIAWTKRFYYEGAVQDALLRWEGQDSLESVSLWPLKPISATRLA